MKTIKLSEKEIYILGQMSAYEKLIKVAKNKNRADIVSFAKNQEEHWTNAFMTCE